VKSERWKIAASVLGSTAVLTVFGLLLAGNPPEPKASTAANDEPPDGLLAFPMVTCPAGRLGSGIRTTEGLM